MKIPNQKEEVAAPSLSEEKLHIDASLTNDIVEFVCDKQLNDVELLRQAIGCQVRK